MMKIVLILIFLIAQVLSADIQKKEPTFVKSTTVGHYMKPGLAVDITYSSQKVDIGELSDINITLDTLLKDGMLKVKITLDKDLSGLDSSHLEFPLSETAKSFSVNLQLSSPTDGIHYINIFAEIEGNGMRAFAIPVYVGDTTKKSFFSKTTEKTSTGVNISVSNAEETITDN